MLTLIVCWMLIAMAALPLGHGLLAIAGHGDANDRIGDWLIRVLWLGLIACQWLAAGVALVTAVTPVHLGLAVAAACAVALVIGFRAPNGGALRERLVQLIRFDTALAALL